MSHHQEQLLLDACRLLFPSAQVNRSFLQYISLDGLKNAYRNRVWEYHPDTAGTAAEPHQQTEKFRKTVEAYKLLSNFLNRRGTPRITVRPAQRRSAVTLPHPVMPAARAADETYYSGHLPTFELKTGLYLYYRGIVSWEALVRALLWQREMRPPLGDFAKQWGWLSEQDISLILRATEIRGSFGERAVELGMLSRSQLNLILLQQRTMQQPIGQYFVSRALLSESLLRRYLRELAEHNRTARSSRSGSLQS